MYTYMTVNIFKSDNIYQSCIHQICFFRMKKFLNFIDCVNSYYTGSQQNIKVSANLHSLSASKLFLNSNYHSFLPISWEKLYNFYVLSQDFILLKFSTSYLTRLCKVSIQQIQIIISRKYYVLSGTFILWALFHHYLVSVLE